MDTETSDTPDPEVEALRQILTILLRFDGETQGRMLRYFLRRQGAGLLGARVMDDLDSQVETLMRAVIRAQRRLIHCYAVGDHVGLAERRLADAEDRLASAVDIRREWRRPCVLGLPKKSVQSK